jgi:hypothetical protein
LEEAVDTHSFQEWKEQTSLTVPPKEPKKSREMTDQPDYWIMALLAFPIADKTPIECLQFISELQKSVVNYGSVL